MAAPEYEYEVWEKRRRTNANEPGKLEAGKYIGKIKNKFLFCPGQTITVNGKKKVIRCIDIVGNDRKIIVD